MRLVSAFATLVLLSVLMTVIAFGGVARYVPIAGSTFSSWTVTFN